MPRRNLSTSQFRNKETFFLNTILQTPTHHKKENFKKTF